jgi:hypothetical protein
VSVEVQRNEVPPHFEDRSRHTAACVIARCLSLRSRILRSRSSSQGPHLRTAMHAGMDSDKLGPCFGRRNTLMSYRTNKDLDPVPRHARKWGVTSFISYWVSDAFKYNSPSLSSKSRSNKPQAQQHGNSHPASSQSVHLPNTSTQTSTNTPQASHGANPSASSPSPSS